MKGEVVDMETRRELRGPVSDFWLAQVEMRLDKIDYVVSRLERQLWVIGCCAAVLALLQAAILLTK